ncbi:MAG: hypothetical protein AB1489_40925, partial [Acidobacteriota bacterium]
PGNYVINVRSNDARYANTEPTRFEVKDKNIAGLELKLSVGASISGTISVEGTNDPEILSKLRIETYKEPIDYGGGLLSERPTSNTGGRFSITRITPGKVKFFIYKSETVTSDFLRFAMHIEHNGVELSNGIDVKPGEKLTDVRISLIYGDCTLSGQVKIPDDVKLITKNIVISARRLDEKIITSHLNQPIPQASTLVDSQGQFTIRGLISGDYELTLWAYTLPASLEEDPTIIYNKQNVTLKSGITETIIVLDPTKKEQQ